MQNRLVRFKLLSRFRLKNAFLTLSFQDLFFKRLIPIKKPKFFAVYPSLFDAALKNIPKSFQNIQTLSKIA